MFSRADAAGAIARPNTARRQPSITASCAGRVEGCGRTCFVKGRLIAILLSGGEAHDCPLAERLIRRVKSPERLLGDKAYDSAELRETLGERGTKPVIPNRCNRKQPFSFNKRLYKLRLAHRECLQQVEGLQAHRHTIRQVGSKLLGVRLSCSCPGMVDLMSLDPS